MQGSSVFRGTYEREGYEGLSTAIVMVAASDYVLARKWLARHPKADTDSYKTKCKRWNKEKRLKEVKSFFASSWGRALVGGDSRWLLDVLDDRVREALEE